MVANATQRFFGVVTNLASMSLRVELNQIQANYQENISELLNRLEKGIAQVGKTVQLTEGVVYEMIRGEIAPLKNLIRTEVTERLAGGYQQF